MNEQVSNADGGERLTCTTGVVRESVARPQVVKSETQRWETREHKGPE